MMGRIGFGVGEVRQMFSDMIPKKYMELGKVLDRFVREEDLELYSPDMGRPSVPPAIMVKVTILQYLDNVSDRRAADAARLPKMDVRVKNTPKMGRV